MEPLCANFVDVLSNAVFDIPVKPEENAPWPEAFTPEFFRVFRMSTNVMP